MEDIIEEIMELKHQRKAVILAHVYQPEDSSVQQLGKQ